MRRKDRKSNKPPGWLNAGWKVPIKLTIQQQKYAKRAIGIARFTYNLALQTHQFHRTNRMPWASALDIQKAFNACKRTDYPFVMAVAKFVAEGGFIDFNQAMQNWRNPEIPAGPPQLKRKKYGNGSFLAGYGMNNLIYNGKRRMRLPGLNSVKFAAPLPKGQIFHQARITLENGRWYLALQTYRPPPTAIETQEIAGVDVGINPLAAIYAGGPEANAIRIEPPRAWYQAERKLARWQRAQARRTPGSRGWREARRRIDKIQRRIKNLRHNAQHQLSAYLVKNFGSIGIESLRVRNLLKNRRLSKALSDAALSSLLHQIVYKARWHDRVLVVADPFYPSSKTCAECAAIYRELQLSEKEWTCAECGAWHDRDKNAARNLRNLITELPAGGRDATLRDGRALAAGVIAVGETNPVERRTRRGGEPEVRLKPDSKLPAQPRPISDFPPAG